jgi:uncharacterized surface protein with fasciclin (FAS1) repeats
MKSIHFATAALLLIAAAPSVHAQDATKPMVMASPTTGQPVVVVPIGANMVDKYKVSWAYRNLDGREVKRYRSEGFTDATIRGAANIALRTGLNMDYVLRQVREVGVPLYTLAAGYGLNTAAVDTDIPGYGVDSISMPMMTPMGGMSGMSSPSAMAAPAAGTIVTAVMANPDLSTLVAAVKAADLVDVLNGPGPFTLFAPTNEAFAKLPAGTLDDLLKPENKEKLRSILTYHVVPGKVMAADVMAMTNPSMPKTVNGATLTVKTTAPVMINGANVTQTDMVAGNGVVHIIDTVLMPPAP